MLVRLLYPKGKEKALTLSYDDGVDTDIAFVELIKKYGIKCTFNINAGMFGPDGDKIPVAKEHFRLSENEVKELYDNPLCEVATHGFTHPHLDSQPTVQSMIEITKDRQYLENLFKRIIRGHAYPYGSYNDEVVDVLKKAGIVYARTTKSHHTFTLPTDWLCMGSTCHHKDSRLPELTDKFINGKINNSDGWLFYLWGHTYEFRNDDNWNVIEQFFEKVANNNNIWYATNIEVYEYVEAYRSLVFSANGKMVYNPTAIDVWAKINNAPVHIPAGKAINL